MVLVKRKGGSYDFQIFGRAMFFFAFQKRNNNNKLFPEVLQKNTICINLNLRIPLSSKLQPH